MSVAAASAAVEAIVSIVSPESLASPMSSGDRAIFFLSPLFRVGHSRADHPVPSLDLIRATACSMPRAVNHTELASASPVAARQ